MVAVAVEEEEVVVVERWVCNKNSIVPISVFKLH
jgi:hypothetical protein